MKITSGLTLFWNVGKPVRCSECNYDLKPKDAEKAKKNLRNAKLVVSVRGRTLCQDCALKKNIITGVVYHS